MSKDTTPKELIIKALRSGEYEQGFDVLYDGRHSFCVLGVICDVYRKHGKATQLSRWEWDDVSSLGCMPAAVSKWAFGEGDDGHGDTNPRVFWQGQDFSLAELNDVELLNFFQLADIIEEQL